jgi:hypothetical protein
VGELRRHLPSGGAIALFALIASALIALPLIVIIGGRSAGRPTAGGSGAVDGATLSVASGGTSSGVSRLSAVSTSPGGVASAPQPSQISAPQPGADPSGQAMPVGDLPGWHQVFADNFSTPVPLGQFPGAVSSKWDDYDDHVDTSGHGTYTPSQVVSISGGVMNLYLHSSGGRALVAAPVPQFHTPDGHLGLLYGRVAVRFRADAVPGYKTAWLLWPDDENWSDGEIDFPEGNLTDGINAYMHYRGNPHNQDAYEPLVPYTAWHTAVLEWTAQAVTFTLDGKVIGRSTDPSVIPRTPMYWVLQTETMLDAPAPPLSAAGNVQVDWVTAYAQA